MRKCRVAYRYIKTGATGHGEWIDCAHAWAWVKFCRQIDREAVYWVEENHDDETL